MIPCCTRFSPGGRDCSEILCLLCARACAWAPRGIHRDADTRRRGSWGPVLLPLSKQLLQTHPQHQQQHLPSQQQPFPWQCPEFCALSTRADFNVIRAQSSNYQDDAACDTTLGLSTTERLSRGSIISFFYILIFSLFHGVKAENNLSQLYMLMCLCNQSNSY